MLDILFVIPSKKPTLREESGGTLLLCTILRQNGINTDIYRYFEADSDGGFSDFVEQTAANILSRNPTIVSFYCRCDCFLANIRIAERLKAQRQDLIIIFGGPQADASSLETIREIPWVDYCSSGEGETTIYPLVSSLLGGEDVSDICGLTYKNKDGNIIRTPRPALIPDLDKNPDIDYSIVPDSIMGADKNSEIHIEVGRGCPFNCAYCSSSIFWQRTFRLKSINKIVEEIAFFHRVHGFNRFLLNHDLFTANKKRVLEFCKALKDNNLNIKWICSARVDTLDEETICAMADSGLHEVFLGIETGSPRIQKAAHKNIKRDDVLRVTKLLVKHNIRAVSSFMYGFPDETEEDLEQTLQLAYDVYKNGIGRLQFHLCAILPGTEYYSLYKDSLVFATTQSNIVGDFGLAENYDFVRSHPDLFPYYYEYSSPLRDKCANLDKFMPVCIGLYDIMLTLDEDKFKGLRLFDLYLAFRSANESLIAKEQITSVTTDNYVQLVCNYLSTLYDEEDVTKLREIFTFANDMNAMSKDKQMVMNVRSYNADLKAYHEKKSLSQIAIKPVMVYFRKQNGQISYVIK
ncbi:MAG: radical SAM protein [Ruminococcus sp.]|nr:radical SAM protein [Ruminococcus sp.]